MKTIKSTLSGSTSRVARLTDLPESTEAGAPAAPAKKGAGKPATKKAEKPAKETPPKKGAKAAPEAKAKPAKKGATSKESKPAKEKAAPTERKPRVEGRVDLVYRSGPERAIAIKLAEKHGFKPEKGIKVDNCTVGYEVKGPKADALKTDYLARREAWRKDQDALVEKHIGKLG